MSRESMIVTDQPVEREERSKIAVGLSACLAGQEVRFNGGHTQSRLCTDRLSHYFAFETFCPEVAAGFGIPRPAMRLTGDPDNPALEFSDGSEGNLRGQLEAGFAEKVTQFDHLDGYILMKKSPSCGLERIKVYQANGHPHERKVPGLFVQALQKRYPHLPMEEDGRLNDARLYENFVLRVYAHHHFRHEVLAGPTLHKLIQFHSGYKYVLMAHDQEAYRQLGRRVAELRKEELTDELPRYFAEFMQALAKPASRENHTNTLLHILGYLKRDVPSAARQDMAEMIHKYRKALVPLVAPLTLIRHYIEQYGSDYIRGQRYLNPYPESLGLANGI